MQNWNVLPSIAGRSGARAALALGLAVALSGCADDPADPTDPGEQTDGDFETPIVEVDPRVESPEWGPLDPDEGPEREFVTYEEFRSSLYCEPGTELCIVERDVPLVGEEAIRDYYERIVRSANPRPNALTVMHAGNRDAKWSVQQRMNLTYCVSDNFGTRKQFVVDGMEAAAQAWEDAAAIDFHYVDAEDANCTEANDNILFPVTPGPSDAPYLARAFFPGYPDEYLAVKINLASYDRSKASGGSIAQNLTLTGILRHELGHTLGFRHEHIRPEAQAYQCFEDNDFRPITEYDSESVMHYPQCNGDGDWSLSLTQLDREGAAQYYPAQPNSTPEQQRCTQELDADGHVREECEPVRDEILRVVNTATRQQLDDELSLDVRAADGIVAFREQKPFENFDELRSVSYVTDNVIRDIYDVIYHGECTFSVDDQGNYPIACLTTVFDILDAANTATFEQLDVDMALDARAAGNIVAIRADNPFNTLAELWSVSYVKQDAVMSIYNWVQQQSVSVDITTDTLTGTAPLTVEFAANARGGDAPLSYEWDFGDGSTGTGQTVSHTYQSAGQFTAEVTVTDAAGESNTDTVEIAAESNLIDLVITDMTVTTQDRDVTFEVTVENQGGKDLTDYTYVDIFLDADSTPQMGQYGHKVAYILDGIPAGQSATVTKTVEDMPMGHFDGYALVNTEEQVTESDLSNNIAGPSSYTIDFLLINEVLYSTPGADSGTFIELIGWPGRDLSGFTLEAINGRDGSTYETLTIPQGTTIPDNGYFVLGDSNTPESDVVSADSDLQNGPDSVLLVDPSGTVLDALGYGVVDGTEVFAGEGSPAKETPKGYSVGRNARSLDSDDNSADFFQWAEPTPGSANYTSVYNIADTCAGAYTISDGVEGRFKVHGNLGNMYNDFGTLDVSQCSSSNSTLSGADQVLRFVVPDGVTADVGFTLAEGGANDIDAAVTAASCSSLEDGFQGCNTGGLSSLTGLAPGAYHIVVFQDGNSLVSSNDEPYTVELDIAYK